MNFRLNPSYFNKFKRKLLFLISPIMLLILVSVSIFYRSDLTLIAFLVPMLLGIILYTIWKLIKRQKVAWHTFELTIGDDQITRTQTGYPNITISKSDVVEVLEAANGNLTIVTKSKSNAIVILNGVENREELLNILSSFTTIGARKSINPALLTYGSIILTLAVLAIFFLSSNFYLSLVLGLGLVSFFLWGFIETQRNMSIDKKAKRSSYAIFIMLAVIIYKLVLAWEAFNG